MSFAKKRFGITGLLAGVLSLTIMGTASAHVVVRPAEVLTAGFQTFTVGVPNEKAIPTTSVKLLIPASLKFVSPTQKTGWTINVEKDGTVEDATVKSITWSGGTVDVGYRDDFTFSAQAPDKTTELQWKAYQTYSDGTVVNWDQTPPADESKDDESSTPFSVTKVVAETADAAALKNAEQSAADAKNTADWALYIGIAGVVIGLVGVYLATRKKK